MMGDAMYVTQLWAHEIVRLDADGSHRVVAGSGERGFANGPEGSSEVSFPNGIALDASSKRLYFNSHMGIMEGGERGAILLRTMDVPTG